jgi:hypothetical protein
MSEQQRTPETRRRLKSLSDALGTTLTAAIDDDGVTSQEALTVLCGLIGWVVANTSPEYHSEIQSYLGVTIPKMIQDGREAQFLKDESH